MFGTCCRAISWNSRHSDSSCSCGYDLMVLLFRRRRAVTSDISWLASYASNARTSKFAAEDFPDVLASAPSFTPFRLVYVRFCFLAGFASVSAITRCIFSKKSTSSGHPTKLHPHGCTQ